MANIRLLLAKQARFLGLILLLAQKTLQKLVQDVNGEGKQALKGKRVQNVSQDFVCNPFFCMEQLQWQVICSGSSEAVGIFADSRGVG